VTNRRPTVAEQATPAEQDAYNRVVTAGIKILYDKSTHDGIVNMLRSGDPADALAKTVSTIMVQLDEKSGGKIPETVILPAAAELLDETAKLATAAKIFQADQKTLAVAMQKLVADLGEKYGVNPDQIKSLLQSVPPDQLQSIVAEQSQYGGGQAQGAPAPAAAPPQGAPSGAPQ
jgi:hypothetical protein